MAQPITSLADFFRKAEKDGVYQMAAQRAYVGFFTNLESWEVVKEKLHEWAKSNVGPGKGRSTCEEMVEYLNTFIEDPTYTRR